MPKERETCTECSMRRQKCDRNIPCGRCVSRGVESRCTREWLRGYDPKVHRVYPKTARKQSSRFSASRQSSKLNTTDEAALPPSSASTASASSPIIGSSATESSRHHQDDSAHLSPGRPATAGNNAACVLEFVKWGCSKLSGRDLQVLEHLREPPNEEGGFGSDWNALNGLQGTRAEQQSYLQLLLPSRQQIFQLVKYHIDSILWYHACFHGPTFHQELQDAYKQHGVLKIEDTDMRWTALLFSIMAGSMACASEQMVSSWGFSNKERRKLTLHWFKATITCLSSADYIWRHHINSVEAITVLTMSAHIVGFSSAQRTLLGSALKIAQGLGLQRLGPDENGHAVANSPPQGQVIVQHEVGRRLWHQLCVQDWVSISFSEMYSIQRRHFLTTKPGNYDENTMQILSDDAPTVTSFPNLLFDICALLPQEHDDLVSLSTPITQYDEVIKYDAKLRRLQTESLPRFFRMSEPVDPNWPAWIPWARRHVRMEIAHKLILVHRKFLIHSFTNPIFDFTRRSCLDAAKTIIMEAELQGFEEAPLLWIDQAFILAGGITLALDMFHRKESEPPYMEHRRLAEIAVTLLHKFDNSAIALRGEMLLHLLLSALEHPLSDDAPSGRGNRAPEDAGQSGRNKRRTGSVPQPIHTSPDDGAFPQWPRSTSSPHEPTRYSPSNDGHLILREMPNLTTELNYDTFEQLYPAYLDPNNGFSFEYF